MNVVKHGPELETRVVEKFEADDLGAPFKVILHNAVSVSCDIATGKFVSYSIPDLDGLLCAIVTHRVIHPRKLAGADIKYIRKIIGVKQKDVAGKIEMSVEHLSRCEGGSAVMSASTEKLFRIFSLKSAWKLHKIKACEEKTKLEDILDKLFDAIKPMPMHDISKPIELHFHRSSSHSKENGSRDDGQWDMEQLAA